MVYVAAIEDGRALIADAADLARSEGPRYEQLRASADLAYVDGSWEVEELRQRLPELPAMQKNYRKVLDEIARFRPPPGCLLDFGCGWGFFLDAARRAGWRVQGLEPLLGHSIYARGALGLSVLTDTLRPSSFPVQSFDVVASLQVFEHLPDPAGELGKLRVLLKPGGIVVIEVPNIDCWGVRLLGRRHRHFVLDHLSFFGPRTLKRLFSAHGFETLSITYPTRTLSVRHLVDSWAARTLPAWGVRALRTVAARTGLLDKEVRLNLGDIVMVIGRKLEEPSV